MHLQSFRKKSLPHRFLILGIATACFLAGFVLNITSNEALYNFNLNVVPMLQTNQYLGSKAFLSFMNVISNIFNPVVCAGYVFIFYLISYRKLEILCFLVWFIFLSWVLSILKMAIHQARPYWISSGSVSMLEWTCYTEFGCPSGHSMMGIILLEFMLRFFARVHRCVSRYIGFFYLFILIIELLVMFSRVILGMHSLNQVLFGLMLGVYSSVPYYLFIEGALMRLAIKIFNHPRSSITNAACLALVAFFWAVELLVALLPSYSSDTAYWKVIKSTSGCSNSKFYRSFQYRCLEDCGLIMAGFGVILGFSWNSKPHNFVRMLAFSRISLKFVARFFMTIVISIIPLAVFLNPLWNEIQTDNLGHTLIIWACQNAGFLLASFFLVALVPYVCEILAIDQFKHPGSYAEFKQFQVIEMINEGQLTINMRETELVQGPSLPYPLAIN